MRGLNDIKGWTWGGKHYRQEGKLGDNYSNSARCGRTGDLMKRRKKNLWNNLNKRRTNFIRNKARNKSNFSIKESDKF